MSDFSMAQQRKLSGKLNRRHVQTRELDGRSIDYIEGWFAIAEANAIFGYSGWDREMTHFERLFERTRADVTSCCYVARVRIRVRTGRTVILREGTGCGSATAGNSSEAHERALKAAETDATKRALATFGNRFGLGLYDKEQNGVTARKTQPLQKGFTIYDPTGAPFAQNLSAESFCTGLRQLVETVSEPGELEGLARYNKDGISRLRREAPKLRTAKNIHYADILERLIEERLKLGTANPRPSSHGPALVSPSTTPPSNGNGSSVPPPGEPLPPKSNNGEVAMAPALVPLRPSKIAPGPRIDKSVLSIPTERRLRDRDHLKFVASHPCLICGRQPSQAHHLTFAQKRGLSLKVSDEFTVPLCAVHHDELHQAGPERPWWDSQGIVPEPIAAELWKNSRTVSERQLAASGTDVQEKVELSKPSTLHP